MAEVHCQLNYGARQSLKRFLSSTALYRAPNFVGSLVRQVGRLLERDLSRQPSEISNWGILIHVKTLCRHTYHMLILYPLSVRLPNSMMPSMNSWHVSDLSIHSTCRSSFFQPAQAFGAATTPMPCFTRWPHPHPSKDNPAFANAYAPRAIAWIRIDS